MKAPVKPLCVFCMTQYCRSRVVPPTDAVMLKVVTYRGKEQVGRYNLMPVEEMSKRAGIKK
jgi:hypothetical protein